MNEKQYDLVISGCQTSRDICHKIVELVPEIHKYNGIYYGLNFRNEAEIPRNSQILTLLQDPQKSGKKPKKLEILVENFDGQFSGYDFNYLLNRNSKTKEKEDLLLKRIEEDEKNRISPSDFKVINEAMMGQRPGHHF